MTDEVLGTLPGARPEKARRRGTRPCGRRPAAGVTSAAGVASAAVTLLMLGLMVFGLAGCSLLPMGRPRAAPGEEPVVPGPGEGEIVLLLYFSDPDATYLVPEERAVPDEGESFARLVIRELVAGPRTADLGRTVPTGVQLLSAEIVEGVAYVNLSREIQTNHWGGSTGEMFTIMSIVNSLTEDPRITAVQFLVEGRRVESLVGHADTTVPIERNEDIIRGDD